VAIWITVWIRGLFSGFVTIGRYGKWSTDIQLLLILIRHQMAALVRRASAEVCTIPVLLVIEMFKGCDTDNIEYEHYALITVTSNTALFHDYACL